MGLAPSESMRAATRAHFGSLSMAKSIGKGIFRVYGAVYGAYIQSAMPVKAGGGAWMENYSLGALPWILFRLVNAQGMNVVREGWTSPK